MTSPDQLFARAVSRQPALAWAAPMAMLLPSFGFALVAPVRALAAMFLMLGFAVWAIAGKARPGWIIALSTLAYLVAAILPSYFSTIAYVIGFTLFIIAGEGAVRR